MKKKSVPKGSDRKNFDEFTKFMYAGIKKGSKKYGEKTYTKLNMVTMAKEEIRDLACYGYFLWSKLNALEEGILTELKEGRCCGKKKK